MSKFRLGDEVVVGVSDPFLEGKSESHLRATILSPASPMPCYRVRFENGGIAIVPEASVWKLASGSAGMQPDKGEVVAFRDGRGVLLGRLEVVEDIDMHGNCFATVNVGGTRHRVAIDLLYRMQPVE
jgi:hypothetical protein